MKIIAGKYKLQKIISTRKESFKPISEALRENIFNVLNSFFSWKEKKILDLFAGSGSLGLEALSRGGKFCYFNDINWQSIKDIRASLVKWQVPNGIAEQNSSHQMLYKLQAKKEKLDLIFLDPPFKKFALLLPTLSLIAQLKSLTTNGCLVIRVEKELELSQIKAFSIWKQKKYGRHWVYFLTTNKKENTLFQTVKNHFLIISGPSGVGKRKIVAQLLATKELNLVYSLSATTRKTRKGEKNRKDYHFINQKKFIKGVENNDFLEYVHYLGDYYGTSQSYIAKLVQKGKNILFEIEIVGALNIKKKIKQATWIYLLPPSWKELRSRMEKRGTEDLATIEKRLLKAKEEVSYVQKNNFCEHYIINEKSEETLAKILKLLSQIWKIGEKKIEKN